MSSLPRLSTIHAADLDVGNSATLDISKLQQTKTGRTYKWINIGILYDAMINIGGTDFKLLAGNYNLLNMYGSDVLLIKNTVSENYNRYTVIASDYIVPMDSFTLKAVWNYKPPPEGHFISKYHKSGTVIWKDDPSLLNAATDRWTQVVGTLTKDNKTFLTGASYKNLTGIVINDKAGMVIDLPSWSVYSQIMGFEFYWLLDSVNVGHFILKFAKWDGTSKIHGYIKWLATGTPRWHLWDGAEKTITGGSEDLEHTKTWHHAKVIVDFGAATPIYKKLISDTIEVDISSYGLAVDAAAGTDLEMQLEFETINVVGGAGTDVGLYIDALQITFAEES